MKYLIPLISLLLFLSSCSEKEDTTPSYADTDRLETLLDHDITKIVDFKEKYGTYILYKFDKTKDFAYQFEQASNWQNASLDYINHDDASAAVDFLYSDIFSCYNDAYKEKYYPRKLLLVNRISSTSELGLSQPIRGLHDAVGSINSVTFSNMSQSAIQEALKDEALLSQYCNAMHRAILADYLVKARAEYPVDDIFLAYSQNYYASLMNSKRKTAAQLINEDPNFFYDRGFFFPSDDESTYFPSAEEDIISYISNMITMDGATANALLDMPAIADKMHLLTIGLQDMGVDVMSINPNMEQFIKMKYVQPATMFASDVVTDTPEADMDVTILRGSHSLDRLEIEVNGTQISPIDLSSFDRMRIIIPVHLTGLAKGANSVTLRLFEEGRDKPATTLTTGVSYATMDEVVGFTIKRSDDHEDVFRRLKIAVGNGGDLDDEENPDLTTISFEKHGYLDRYFMEQDAEYRYWKMYKQNGRITSIIEYLQDGFNETYTAPLYRITGSYALTYNDNGELTEVTHTDDKSNKQIIVTDIQYILGRIVHYTYCGKVYEPKYATVNGITTRTDCLDAEMSGHTFSFDCTEDLNPYYMPDLPAVFPGSISEIPLQILYSQYLFKSLDGVWSDGWHRNIADKLNYAEVNMDGITWTYRFKLK